MNKHDTRPITGNEEVMYGMKYIWIIILVIAYVIWGVYAVKDLIYCIKHCRHPLSVLDESSAVFFAISIIFIFAISLVLWVEAYGG